MVYPEYDIPIVPMEAEGVSSNSGYTKDNPIVLRDDGDDGAGKKRKCQEDTEGRKQRRDDSFKLIAPIGQNDSFLVELTKWPPIIFILKEESFLIGCPKGFKYLQLSKCSSLVSYCWRSRLWWCRRLLETDIAPTPLALAVGTDRAPTLLAIFVVIPIAFPFRTTCKTTPFFFTRLQMLH